MCTNDALSERAWGRYAAIAVVALLLVLLVWALRSSVSAQGTEVIRGFVVDTDGRPAAGATVRIQATANSAATAADGSFALQGLTTGISVTVSAWKYGYYCAMVQNVTPPATDVRLTLRLYQENDNPDYAWILPISADPTEMTCATCKLGVTQIWLDNDAHAKSGSNPRFLSMYNGTDLGATEAISPGFKTDFPGTAGNCANCHAPGAAMDAPFSMDMNELPALDRDFGVHCDFCHKVAAVYLNPATGLPYANAPGVISMDVRRPFPETERYQLFFGTFDDDNVPQEDTFLPLIKTSQWCAPCHQFSFWGTPIYQSFAEWLASPYPAMGVECQTCHMPPDGVMTNVAPGQGGVERDPRTIHAHTMPGAASVPLLQRTVAMTLTAQATGGQVSVEVTLTNVFGGHHVPTDYPGRNMILVLSASDATGRALQQIGGPVVPAWGGSGEAENDYAGWPGQGYAKILRDAVTGEQPVVHYWKPTFIASDNRIAAKASDVSHYRFALPAVGNSGTVRVSATLWFRRLFVAQARAKGWDMPDVLMAQAEASVAAHDVLHWSYLPLLRRP